MENWRLKVKAEMKAKGITQEDMAEHLGVTQGAIGHMLRNLRGTTVEQFIEMAKVISVSPSQLLPDTISQNEIRETKANYKLSTNESKLLTMMHGQPPEIQKLFLEAAELIVKSSELADVRFWNNKEVTDDNNYRPQPKELPVKAKM